LGVLDDTLRKTKNKENNRGERGKNRDVGKKSNAGTTRS